MSKFIRKSLLANLAILVLVALFSERVMSGVLALPQFKSNKERLEFEHKALAGSPEAADEMAGHFLLLAGNAKLFWATIAAENGSRIGVYNVANILAEMPDEMPYGQFRRDREFFWLQKALADGNKDAIAILKDQFPNPKEYRLSPEEQVNKWVLSKRTLAKFKRTAMRGSPEAAYRLYQSFFSHNSDISECIFWARIAAQNGHPKAPYAVGALMLKTGKPNDRMRACFWLRKAVATGEKDAGKLLKKACPGEQKQ